MNAKQELFDIFEEMGFEYWLMHQMPANKKYPSSFFTYLTTDAPFIEYHDNKPMAVSWAFMIGFYTDDPGIMDITIIRLMNKLQAAGWIVEGPGEDVESDEPTHTGRRLTIGKIELLESEGQ